MKMTDKGKRINCKKVWFALAAVVLCAWCATGCAKKSATVSITDGMVQTELAVASGTTVEEALSEAEITLGEKDEVTPDAGSVLTDQAEVTIRRCAKVTVTDGEQSSELELVGKQVQDALDAAGVVLGTHDYINHATEAYLTDGMNITVTHRLVVTVHADGDTKEYLTKATDVASLLEEQGIALDEKDKIQPETDAELSEGMEITIERVSVKEITETESIPFETEIEYSSSLYTDETEEKTAGVEGEKEVTYQVTYVDGVESSRKALSETVIKEPVSQVVVQGTKERRRVVSKQKIEDCDGSGHGYYIITWSDGTVDYQDY